MVYVEMFDVIDPNGTKGTVRHEAPRGPQGQTAIAYLKPSGATYPNPIHRDPVTREPVVELVSDQKWLYDPQEAADAQRDHPDRYVAVRA